MSKRAATYLDSNAGAPLQPRVVEVLLPFLSASHPQPLPNPSSIHSFGRSARRLLSDAREQIAASLGSRVDPDELLLTSSGTEANQTAIRGVLDLCFEKGRTPRWLTTPVEHDSVLQVIRRVRERGGVVELLPVDAQGRVPNGAIHALARSETTLVSVIWVNNETGVIQDIERLTREARSRGALMHVDAAQAWGKLPFDLNSLGADLVSFSGHKIGAPAGTGVLWIRKGCKLSALIDGKQEKGRRGGTENLLGAIALGAAAGGIDPQGWIRQLEPLRNRVESAICSRIPGTMVHGADAPRVANTLNVSFQGLTDDGLVMALDLAGYCVSSGAACSSGGLDASHVLLALGRSAEEARGAIRISLPGGVAAPNEQVLDAFVDELERIVARMRGLRNPEPVFKQE